MGGALSRQGIPMSSRTGSGRINEWNHVEGIMKRGFFGGEMEETKGDSSLKF